MNWTLPSSIENRCRAICIANTTNGASFIFSVWKIDGRLSKYNRRIEISSSTAENGAKKDQEIRFSRDTKKKNFPLLFLKYVVFIIMWSERASEAVEKQQPQERGH